MAHLSGGRGADRGVPLRRGLPRRHRVVGLRRAARAGRARAAPPDQGDELRPGVRAERVRPVPAARASPPTRRAALMEGYFDRFGGVRDYLHAGRRPGPPGRLHRDHAGPPPLPARPDQRQPAAPRDGRADGAQRADPGLARPTSSRWRCCGVDARAARGRAALADAAAGARRAGLRGGAGRAGGAGGAGARARWAARTRSTCRWRCPSACGRDWDSADH